MALPFRRTQLTDGEGTGETEGPRQSTATATVAARPTSAEGWASER